MLTVTEITKHYGEFTLGPIELTIENEVLVVLGPSGSGKTTLLSLIAGITPLDAGEISLGGNMISNIPIEHRNAGLVFQDGSLFPHMTARENIEYATTTQSSVTDVAETLEITGVLDQTPATLSGGETQRVALARTLAADPDILLLDEPLSSLDTPTRQRLRDELHTVFDSLEIPVILVTHNQRTAMALGDRLAILRDGKIEQIGTPTEVTSEPESPFVAQFTGNTNLLEATVTDRENDTVFLKTGGFTLRTTGEYSVGDTVIACIHPARITIRTESTPHPGPNNSMQGVVERWLHESTQYRVDVRIPEIQSSVTVTISPNAFDDLSLHSNDHVVLEFPPSAIHVITDTDSGTPTQLSHQSA